MMIMVIMFSIFIQSPDFFHLRLWALVLLQRCAQFFGLERVKSKLRFLASISSSCPCATTQNQ